MRPFASASAFANARTISVLPKPGTPSISTWPEAANAATTCSTTAVWPTSAWPIAVLSFSKNSAALVLGSVSLSMCCPMTPENMPARHLQQRHCAPQVERAIRGILHTAFQIGGGHFRQLRYCRRLLRERQAFVARNATHRDFLECARRRGVQRRAAAPTQREMPRPTDV